MVYGLLATLKNLLQHHFTNEKKKKTQKRRRRRKIDTNSWKEILIRSGYCKSLLNQAYMLFVKNMNFYVPVFQLFPESSS